MDNWPTPEMIAEYKAEQRMIKQHNNPDPIEQALSNVGFASLLARIDSQQEDTK